MTGRPRARRLRSLAGWLLPVLLVTACATTTTGQAVRDADAPPLLDTGNYPTTPNPPLGPAGDAGAVYEAHRMAEAVVGPWEVDPALTGTGSVFSTLVWKNTAAMSSSLEEPVPTIAARHRYLTGFSTDRQAEVPAGRRFALQIAVLRFPTVEDAAGAATELAAAPDAPGESRVPMPGHPDANARTATLRDGTVRITATTPHGMFVVFTYARAEDGNTDSATRLATRAIDLQKPRLDRFEPTPQAEFPDIPRDPGGFLNRVIPPAPDRLTPNHGTWGPHGALHFSPDPIVYGDLFDDADVRWVATGMDVIHQTRDAAGAETLMSGLLELGQNSDPPPAEAEAVPGLEASHCFDDGPPAPGSLPSATRTRYDCMFRVDSYTGLVSSHQLPDAHQRAAAQYAMDCEMTESRQACHAIE